MLQPLVETDGFREELVERALALPVGDPASVLRVVELCDSPDTTPQSLAAEVRNDETLSALLLRSANSAAAFSATRVGDLPSAIIRLGFREVSALALGAPGLKLLQAAGPLTGTRAALHRHAICVGLAARELLPADAERALAAGLLHNLGLHVIATCAPGELRHLLEAKERGRQFSEVEEHVFGFSHAELGALLAERWQYPLDLVVAIRDHDLPAPQTRLAATVQLCDILARRHGLGIEPTRPLPDQGPIPAPALIRAPAVIAEIAAHEER